MNPVDLASTLVPVALDLLDVMPDCDIERVVITADVIGGEPYWDVCVRDKSGWVTTFHGFKDDEDDKPPEGNRYKAGV